jgi:hypothetical protein
MYGVVKEKRAPNMTEKAAAKPAVLTLNLLDPISPTKVQATLPLSEPHAARSTP